MMHDVLFVFNNIYIENTKYLLQHMTREKIMFYIMHHHRRFARPRSRCLFH